ncbi:MAG: TRAP transporter small permease [Chitinophagaceae bacterium]|nr:TRAP transporter small permease [Rubrivivax sp.]
MNKLVEALCGALAALALFGIMALTLVDVLGRKLISQSMPGSLELTEILMVVVIFAALPLVSQRGEHVVFDSLDPWLPRGLRRVQQGVVDGLICAAMLGVTWLMADKAWQLLSYGEITAQLKLPVGLFVYLMSALCALTALVHALLVWRPVSHHHPGVADGPGA